MDSPQLDRALRLKTNSVRGGTIEKVFMRNVTVGQVREAIVAVDFNYEEGNAGSFPPIVRDIEVRNVTSRKSTYVLLLRGYANDPITNLRLINCKFDNVERPDVLEHVKDVVFENVSINGMILNKTITQ
jgi:polygalacturonase